MIGWSPLEKDSLSVVSAPPRGSKGQEGLIEMGVSERQKKGAFFWLLSLALFVIPSTVCLPRSIFLQVLIKCLLC